MLSSFLQCISKFSDFHTHFKTERSFCKGAYVSHWEGPGRGKERKQLWVIQLCVLKDSLETWKPYVNS